MSLNQLSTSVIRDFEDKLRSGLPAPLNIDGKARSPAMTKRIVGSLSSILGDAQERGLVARNVVRELQMKRRPGKERAARETAGRPHQADWGPEIRIGRAISPCASDRGEHTQGMEARLPQRRPWIGFCVSAGHVEYHSNII